MDRIEQELQKKYGSSKVDPVEAALAKKYGNQPVAQKETADQKAAKNSWALFPAEVGKDTPVSGTLKAAGNLVPSAAKLGVDLLKLGGNALLYDNPISLMFGIGKEKSIVRNTIDTVQGGVQKLTPGVQEDEAKFDSMVSALKERYGSLDALQRTATNDPFAFGADVVGLISGGAAMVGKTGALANVGSKVAKTATAPVRDAATIAKTVTGKASDIITPMDKGVEGVLSAQKAPDKWTGYLDTAKAAAEDYHLPSALEKAGDVAGDALDIINKTRGKIGEAKTNIVRQMADVDTGPVVKNALNNMHTRLQERLGVILKEDGTFDDAPGRESLIESASDKTLLNLVNHKLAKTFANPTFQRVDDTIDYIQGLVYGAKKNMAMPLNGKVEGILKQTAGELNEGLRQVGGPEYTNLNRLYGETQDVFESLSKALGKESNKGGSLMKRVFSPTDGGTKKLFEKVYEITGIDLIEEATLAKYAMELAGDSRQASLLEQLDLLRNPSKAGLIEGAARKVLSMLQSPEGKARRLVDKATGKKTKLETVDAIKNTQPGLTIKDVSKDIPTTRANKSAIIDDMDNALIQEAKKYKSAEEFVKAQGTPVYHGTRLENADKIKLEGFKVGAGKGVSGQASSDFIYAAKNEAGAKRYVTDRMGIKTPTVIKGSFDGKVLEIQGKMADFEAFGEASRKLGVPLELGSQGKPTMLNMPAIKEAMQEQGYGAISFSDMYENGTKAYAILPDKIKTKSKLEEIWKKANSSTPDPLIQEAKKYKSAEEFINGYAPGKTISLNDTVPNDLMFILDEAYKYNFGQGLPEKFYSGWDGIKLKDLYKELDIAGTADEMISESTIKIKKAGYGKIGESFITDEGIKTKSQLTDIWKKANSSSEN